MTTPPHGCISYCSSLCLLLFIHLIRLPPLLPLFTWRLPLSLSHSLPPACTFLLLLLHMLYSLGFSPNTSSCASTPPGAFSSYLTFYSAFTWRFPLLILKLHLHLFLLLLHLLLLHFFPFLFSFYTSSSFLPILHYFPPPPTCHLPWHLLLFRRHLRQVNVLSSLDNTRIDLRAPPPVHNPTYHPHSLLAVCLAIPLSFFYPLKSFCSSLSFSFSCLASLMS